MKHLSVLVIAVTLLSGCLVPARPFVVAAPIYNPSGPYPVGATYGYQPYVYYRRHPAYSRPPVLIGQPVMVQPRPQHLGPRIGQPRRRW